jgi:hypothetical protein
VHDVQDVEMGPATAVCASPAAARRVRSEVAWYALLTVLWLLPGLVIGTSGEFPLNDDWAYAIPVKTFLETGRLERLAWTWTPIVTHVAVGSAFSSTFGYSFETLRWASLLFGWLGVLGTYQLCRRLDVGPERAALAAALIGLNPIYLNLSYTFMTDIPFLGLAIWSQVLLVAALQRRSWLAMAGGIGLALAATLSRQTGLALVLALPAAILVSRASLRGALAALAVGGLGVVGYTIATRWLLSGGSDPGTYFGVLYSLEQMIREESTAFFLVRNGITLVVYLGVFLSPLVALGFSPGLERRAWPFALAVIGLASYGIVRLGMPMPPGINIVRNLGLGPTDLAGIELLPQAPAWLWWIGSVAGLYCIAHACASLVRNGWQERITLRADPARIFLLAFAVAYTLPHLSRSPYFDRYLFVIAPTLAALLLRSFGGAPAGDAPAGLVRRAASALLLVGLGVFAVAGTRDYLEHNRARWALLNGLLADGITPRQIDGGFEFGGYFNFTAQPETLKKGKLGRWVEDDEYRISYAAELPGYREIRQRSYARLLPPGEQMVFVLQRIPLAGASTGED